MPNTKLLIATNNKGKLKELRVLLSAAPYELIAPSQIGLFLDVDECAKTYAANARLKALSFAKASGMLTLADDSGLEVDALNKAPGIYSARYAGPNASDAERVDYLLSKLKDVPVEKRSARFVCVIAIISPDERVRLCSGRCRGIITTSPQGTGGFGYDPIFLLPRLGKTMAELSYDMKNRISHRARAAKRASQLLQKLSFK
ncbi:MAG: XTP/dITP diphosphatase [Dehalococcoidia bacterium]|nr:XTP/dITP diphosphatase [Dehalococcoidia bacterium]